MRTTIIGVAVGTVLLFVGPARAGDEPVPRPPSLGQFPQELGKNFLSLFRPHNLRPLLIGAGATGAALLIDDEVTDYFAERDLATAFEPGDIAGGPAVVGGAVAVMFIASRFSDRPRFQSLSYTLAQSWILNKAIVGGLKASVTRMRPDERNQNAFPSGHASSAFMLAAVADRYFGRKVTVAAYGWAGYVFISRLEGGDHYLSDLAAGSTIGLIIGHTVADRMLGGADRRVRLEPQWTRYGPAVVVALSF